MTRKRCSFLMPLLVVFAAMGGFAADGVFPNPDMEDGTVAGWSQSIGPSNFSITASAGAANSGNYGLDATFTAVQSGADGSIETIATGITPGNAYSLSFYLQTSSTGTNSQLRVYDCQWLDASDAVLGTEFDDDSYEYGTTFFEVTRNSDGLDTWWTAPAGAAKFRFHVRFYCVVGASFYLDDLQLIDMGGASTPTETPVPPTATDTPVPPTATSTPLPTVNAWHIPGNYEVCGSTTSMRDPVTPSLPSSPVWIHTGIYPIGGASVVTVFYRESTAGSWSSVSSNWECNYTNNDYWGQAIPGGTASWSGTVQYYILVTHTGNSDTYIYNGSSISTDPGVAQADPYEFTFPAAATSTPTETPVPPSATPTNTPVPPSPTPTEIPTETPVPPTGTPTDTPTYGPSPTPTGTPILVEVLINELYYNSPGADTGCYIELYYPGGVNLSGYQLVAINGADGSTYDTFSLTGYSIPADGYLVIAQDASVTNADIIDSFANLQNGPDNIQVRAGPITIDAVGYGIFGGTDVFVGQGSPAAPPTSELYSLSRWPNGANTGDNSLDFRSGILTPGEENSPPPTATPTFTETPTPTNTPIPTVNAWHIPDSAEACDYNAGMRTPLNPADPADPVCLYTGVYPIGGADTITLQYRINSGAWNTHDFEWECNDGGNDYWWTFCDNSGAWWVPGATFSDTVDYYIAVTRAGLTTTYLYSETAPSRTETEGTAQADPFTFTYPAAPTATPTITPTPAPTDTPTAGPSPTPTDTSTPAPTATNTPVPTVNAWHIPDSAEACDYNSDMRTPLNPADPADPVCLYTGVYPIGGADTITLQYRINSGTWSTHDFEWECNDSGNDYWWTFCDNTGAWWVPGATYSDTVDYYIAVTRSGLTTTYLYSETTPSRTDSEASAQADPFTFTYPAAPTATPTGTATLSPTDTPTPGPTDTPTVAPTETPVPTVNAWHIPDSAEACDYDSTMRYPVSPANPINPVCIYAGVYPITGADGVTLYYRINAGAWNTHAFEWKCNDTGNDYWWTFCDNSGAWWIPGAGYGDTVDYYLEVSKSGYITTYLHSETTPSRTDDELVAQADPYTFTYPAAPTPTFTAGPTATPTPGPSATPTATPTAAPTINAWHIPRSAEACSYDATMRNPADPLNPADPVCVYAGVFPIMGADSMTLHYRVNSGSWSSITMEWECNDSPNDYWWTFCDNSGAWWVPGTDPTDTIEYYIEVSATGFSTTYLFSESAPDRTDNELVAQADPFVFSYSQPIPSMNYAGLILVLILLGGVMVVSLRRR